jgi:hypothetical protein
MIEVRATTLRRLRVPLYGQLTGFQGSRCRAVRVFRPRGLPLDWPYRCNMTLAGCQRGCVELRRRQRLLFSLGHLITFLDRRCHSGNGVKRIWSGVCHELGDDRGKQQRPFGGVQSNFINL